MSEKSNYIGAPACFKLDMMCQLLNKAFGSFGCYQVGSSLKGPDWRDVDVRYIMDDTEFDQLFKDSRGAVLQSNVLWWVLCTSISTWMSEQTGLPIDFQIQRQTDCNKSYPGMRVPLGLMHTTN